MSDSKTKAKKVRPSVTWKKKDRFPVIFWVSGAIKRTLIARAKKEAGGNRAELFRRWLEGKKAPAKKAKKAARVKPNGVAKVAAAPEVSAQA